MAAATRPPVNRTARGSAAEDRAVAALIAEGYRIFERNVRLRIGELDVVAWEDDVLAFVEVRSRQNDDFGAASFAIHPAKQRQVAKVARAYLALRRLTPRRCRFDVVAITGDELVLLRDAFRVR